jgi:hypothetical protein
MIAVSVSPSERKTVHLSWFIRARVDHLRMEFEYNFRGYAVYALRRGEGVRRVAAHALVSTR